MKTGMQKCSFFDDATGTVVQLNSISEEGEIKIKEPLASKDADGGERFAGHHSRIEITGYDDTGYDQLKTWMDDETPLKFVSYGIEGHILWYRKTKITVKKNLYIPPGKSNSFTVVMEQKGGDHSGFDGNQIWYGTNLIYGAKGWQDKSGDGVVDNYSVGGDTSKSFASDQQTITANSAVNNLTLSATFPYPISGVVLKFRDFIVSSNITSCDNAIFLFTHASAVLVYDMADYMGTRIITTIDQGFYIGGYVYNNGVMSLGAEVVCGCPFLGSYIPNIVVKH